MAQSKIIVFKGVKNAASLVAPVVVLSTSLQTWHQSFSAFAKSHFSPPIISFPPSCSELGTDCRCTEPLPRCLIRCLCVVCYSKFFRRSVTGDYRSSISSGSGTDATSSVQEGASPSVTAGNSTTETIGSKPRSLRFTWSMKTTSSMDPGDMMKEIRKVIGSFVAALTWALTNLKQVITCVDH